MFILPSDEGLTLATQWAADADCTLRAPASSLVHLAMSHNKTAILHSAEVELEGDSAVLVGNGIGSAIQGSVARIAGHEGTLELLYGWYRDGFLHTGAVID